MTNRPATERGRSLPPALLLFASLICSLTPFGAVHAQEWELLVCAERDNMPFSNERGEGFENRIAELLAQELGAEPEFVWLDSTTLLTTQLMLQDGMCDLRLGVTEGGEGIETTLPYYRSRYMFVTRADAPHEIRSLDDPELRELRIGVHAATGGMSATSYALSQYGLQGNQVTYLVRGEGGDLGELVRAVARGEVDIALVWGPVAAWYAAREEEGGTDLVYWPVSPEIVMPFVPLVQSIAGGVRSGDLSLRDELDRALARRWEDVQRILDEFGVPGDPLPAPVSDR